jgi:hypothetical protein
MKQQAERGVLWRLVDAIGGQTTSFIAFLILARLLRPDDSSVVTLAAAIVATRCLGTFEGGREDAREGIRRQHLLGNAEIGSSS